MKIDGQTRTSKSVDSHTVTTKAVAKHNWERDKKSLQYKQVVLNYFVLHHWNARCRHGIAKDGGRGS